ncbi:MAG: signal recognition particle-docking protein FtsY [Leptospirillia bacterium]
MSGIFSRLSAGLAKSRAALSGRLSEAVAAHDTIDQALLEEVEEILITADLGMATTLRLTRAIDDEIRYNRLTEPARLWEILATHLGNTIKAAGDGPFSLSEKPTVVLVVGVNGVGKTTTIGKLAAHYTSEGRKVMLGASDTFRAAASDQLALWGKKLGVDVIRHREGADASAVAYDACEAASARGADLLLIDTAGRLHTNVNLMAELEKVHRVVGKVVPGAPHEVLLVLDATTGQNALNQAKTFAAAVRVTGLCLTKMDSTARGGILVNLADTLKVPVRFIGVGEQAEDLQPFDADSYVSALLKNP